MTIALDIPEAAGSKIPRRNKSVTGDQRKGLVIDGGPKSIRGQGHSGCGVRVPRPVPEVDVYLGEVRTDEAGRLLFLGGHGVSASPSGSPIFNESDPNGFINADGWYDDMSDGPVTAEVTIEGRSDSGGGGVGADGPAQLRSERSRGPHSLRPAVRRVHPGRVARPPRRGVVPR